MQWRQAAAQIAAARQLMKCCKSKPSGGFKPESLSCCSVAVNTSPSENVMVLSGQGRRRCAANTNSGKMARGGAGRVITEPRHMHVLVVQCVRRGVEVVSVSAVVIRFLGDMGSNTAFQPGSRALSVTYLVLVFFRWLESGFIVLLWECKFSL